MNGAGLILCAKYSVAPNYFGYCGPDKNSNLLDHLREGIGDREVESILGEFATLYLNLKFISSQNKIPDVFDSKVVEAYWIGNSLLDGISNRDYSYLLDELFEMPKKVGNKQFSLMRKKILTFKLYPHHSFHVFNIFKRTGNDPSFHTMQTMDECRIAWGRVESVGKDGSVRVSYLPLTSQNNRIKIGKETIRTIKLEYKKKRFIGAIKAGDLVSFHWGFVCDVISPIQVKHLSFYTQKAIDYYNT